MLKMLNSWLMRRLSPSPASRLEIGKNGGRVVMEDRDDGLNFFRGLIMAFGMSSVLWSMIWLIVWWIFLK